jgi:hypothetical protein
MWKNDEIFTKSEHQSETYQTVRRARSGALSENIEVIPHLLKQTKKKVTKESDERARGSRWKAGEIKKEKT